MMYKHTYRKSIFKLVPMKIWSIRCYLFIHNSSKNGSNLEPCRPQDYSFSLQYGQAYVILKSFNQINTYLRIVYWYLSLIRVFQFLNIILHIDFGGILIVKILTPYKRWNITFWSHIRNYFSAKLNTKLRCQIINYLLPLCATHT